MALATYNKKRNFKATPEPAGKTAKKNLFRFVVQRHDATRLHYDFRLEIGVMVEDHPVSYIDFEGVIPEGNYGAGTVEVWDSGAFFPVDQELNKITERQALLALGKGELKIFLKGKKLEGGFVLVRLKKDEKNWLLIKHKDEFAVNKKYDSEKFSKAAQKKQPKKKK